MLKDILRLFQTSKPPADPASGQPKPAAAKPSTKPKGSKSQDRLVFIGLTLVVIGGYYGVEYITMPDPEAQKTVESVIPLAQLTGKIGVQPKTETPEQQFRRENKNLPLSDGSTLPANIVAERTQVFRQEPAGDPELAYEMRLPTSWIESRFTQYGTPGKERYKVLTNIARFFGPSVEDKRPFVWLEVEALDRLTTAEHYMNNYLIKRGITPETVKITNGERAETLFIQTRDYNTYVVRALFVINGDRLTVMSFGVPIETYKTYKDIMGLTLSSYHMLQPIARQPEPLASYKLLNILTFDYPARWQTRNQNRASSLSPSVEFVLPTALIIPDYTMDRVEQIEGLMLVNAWRNTPTFHRGVLEETIIKRLGLARMKLESVLQPEKVLLSSDKRTRITQLVYVGLIDASKPTTEEFGLIQDTSPNPRQEVWVTIFDNADYTAAITLITWPQTRNYTNWSYNLASYQKILDTLNMRQSVY